MSSIAPAEQLWSQLPATVNGLSHDLMTAALAWSELVPVFPCRPGAKQPATRNGFKDATDDPDRIERWWQRHPDHNIAAPTGAVFDVLDVDVKGDAPGASSLHALTRAGMLAGSFALASTPSGGVHVYFPASGQGCHAAARLGLDYKGNGGYVLLAPSLVEQRQYRLLDVRPERAGNAPQWAVLLDSLTPRPSVPRVRGFTSSSPRGIDPLVRFVDRQHESSHNRNNGLYWAAKRAVEQEHDPWPLYEHAVANGLDPSSAQATIRSALKGRP